MTGRASARDFLCDGWFGPTAARGTAGAVALIAGMAVGGAAGAAGMTSISAGPGNPALLPANPTLMADALGGPFVTAASVMSRLADLGETSLAGVDGEKLETTLTTIYAKRNFQPVWTDVLGLNSAGRAALDVLMTSAEHGIDPDRYLLPPEMMADLTLNPRPDVAATVEIALSEAVLRYVLDVTYGAARSAVNRAVTRPRPIPEDWAAVLGAVMLADDPAAALADAGPDTMVYRRLKAKLAHYRALAADEAVAPIESSLILRPGRTGLAVAAVRARLGQLGDYDEPPSEEPEYYDADLARAVARFQARYGLVVDGTVGPQTLRALNRPVERIMALIEANMERERWQPVPLEPRQVVVDIPRYTLEVREDGHVVMDMPVIVGRSDRQTPAFSDAISYLEFNPNWYVPETIAKHDIIPAILSDPFYLEDKGFKVFEVKGRQRGAEIDPFFIDWAALAGVDRLPVSFMQRSGRENPLGSVKFMFPNEYAVYLHDTPKQHQFRRSVRLNSSGCVRVRYPEQLAAYLLRSAWDLGRVRATIQSGRRVPKQLPEKVSVHLRYRTADVGRDGQLRFLPDIYGRDRRLIRALAADSKTVR